MVPSIYTHCVLTFVVDCSISQCPSQELHSIRTSIPALLITINLYLCSSSSLSYIFHAHITLNYQVKDTILQIQVEAEHIINKISPTCVI
jgi:hypothetical protein